MVRGIRLKSAKVLFKKSLVVLARRRHHLQRSKYLLTEES
jgi:hypothetical protein